MMKRSVSILWLLAAAVLITGCENLPDLSSLNPCEFIDCGGGFNGSGATGEFPPDIEPGPVDPATTRGGVLGTGSEPVESLACQDARGDADSQCQSAGCLMCASKSECACSCTTSGENPTPICNCTVVGAMCLQ